MKYKLHQPSCEDYVACMQRGGGLGVYSGSMIQRGYGIGGLFRGLASTLLPLLPKVGKIVAKTALGVASDKLAGVPLSTSLKKRGKAAGKKMVLQALGSPPAPASVAVKRNKRRRTVGGKRIKTPDLFGKV